MKKKIHLAFDLSWTMVLRPRCVCPVLGLPASSQHRHVRGGRRTAERGGFDMIFFADSTGIPDTWHWARSKIGAARRGWPRFEMSPWIATMAQVTPPSWFGLTYASTFTRIPSTRRGLHQFTRPHPHERPDRVQYHLSQRRADYPNDGYDELVDHNERYGSTEEFITCAGPCGYQRRYRCFRVGSKIRHGRRPAQSSRHQSRWQSSSR